MLPSLPDCCNLAKLHLFHVPSLFACRHPPEDVAQHAQHTTGKLNLDGQEQSVVAEADWPQDWPEIHQPSSHQSQPSSHQSQPSSQQPQPSSHQSHHVQQVGCMPVGPETGLQGPSRGFAQRSVTCTVGGSQQSKRGCGSAERPHGGHGGECGLNTVRADTPVQQSCQPSSLDPQQAKWQHQKHLPSQHWPAERKRQGVTAQRRLYKHGPVIPKSAAGQRPIRRRQRPEWDDHLTSAGPQTQGGPDRGAAGGFSPHPTAKELLQEALARIQTASSPRPQHAKRQRRGTALEQAQLHATAPQRQATAADKMPQLQHAGMNPSRSCEADATAANRSERSEAAQHAQRQPKMVMQHAKQSLVKQHAFGGKPSWVRKDQPSGCAMQPAEPGDDTHLQVCIMQSRYSPFAAAL